jgi:hypothetical protein
MNYAIQMGSCAMIHVRSFINFRSGILKLLGGEEDKHTDTQATG